MLYCTWITSNFTVRLRVCVRLMVNVPYVQGLYWEQNPSQAIHHCPCYYTLLVSSSFYGLRLTDGIRTYFKDGHVDLYTSVCRWATYAIANGMAKRWINPFSTNIDYSLHHGWANIDYGWHHKSSIMHILRELVFMRCLPSTYYTTCNTQSVIKGSNMPHVSHLWNIVCWCQIYYIILT